jgi:hypothetical protein
MAVVLPACRVVVRTKNPNFSDAQQSRAAALEFPGDNLFRHPRSRALLNGPPLLVFVNFRDKCQKNFHDKCQVFIRSKCYLTPERRTVSTLYPREPNDNPDICLE